jgi:hypothetical protein
MDFDPDEIVSLAGKEMTAKTAIRRLIANQQQTPSDSTIVRDGRHSVLTSTDIERLAKAWGVNCESGNLAYRG